MNNFTRQNAIVTAQLDSEGALIDADARLLNAHLENGGTHGGILALPALLELCQRARRLDMQLSRAVTVYCGETRQNIWATAKPGAEGATLEITGWSDSDAGDETSESSADAPEGRVDDTRRIGADGRIRLDAQFKILSMALGPGIPDMAPNNYILRTWTDIFDFPQLSGRFDETALWKQDWRIYDGQVMALRECGIKWLVSVVPEKSGADQPEGYNVYLRVVETENTIAPKPELLDSDHLEKLFSGQLGSTLRQPIGRIIANAQTIGEMLQGPLRSDYASYAKDIAQAGQHLLALVEDLSDLEVVEREGFRAAEDEIELGDLARRAAGLLAVKASDHNIRIDIPCEDETMPALGEFRRVLQILLNLLTNAIRYSPDGSMIWLRLERAGDRAQIIVADQGSGLSPEDQARVFDKFERLGRSGDGGSGLGLYISRKLARAMGGDLQIESAPGLGARFILELPYNFED